MSNTKEPDVIYATSEIKEGDYIVTKDEPRGELVYHVTSSTRTRNYSVGNRYRSVVRINRVDYADTPVDGKLVYMGTCRELEELLDRPSIVARHILAVIRPNAGEKTINQNSRVLRIAIKETQQ
jgi:hypothetical protein